MLGEGLLSVLVVDRIPFELPDRVYDVKYEAHLMVGFDPPGMEQTVVCVFWNRSIGKLRVGHLFIGGFRCCGLLTTVDTRFVRRGEAQYFRLG